MTQPKLKETKTKIINLSQERESPSATDRLLTTKQSLYRYAQKCVVTESWIGSHDEYAHALVQEWECMGWTLRDVQTIWLPRWQQWCVQQRKAQATPKATMPNKSALFHKKVPAWGHRRDQGATTEESHEMTAAETVQSMADIVRLKDKLALDGEQMPSSAQATDYIEPK